MKITIIRHGDPDYEHDSLTEKGFKQAELLKEVLLRRHFDEIYLSPYGRAQRTAEPYLKAMNREPDGVLPWLKEAPWIWDREPRLWTEDPLCYDADHWIEAPVFEATPEIKKEYESIESSFYQFLEEHGYKKEGGHFLTDGGKNERSILFFCHLGSGSYLLSRLAGVSPAILWMNFFMPTSSISVAQTEEIEPGHAGFRIRCFGSLPHLEGHEELLSEAGAFRESAKSQGREARIEKK
ncbi:MAG: histidine phosphatase family protein [Candidatus Enteromonas sp.]|nr:histidine phosphatase family protein [bacterium]MDD6916942.1 histidine phosphatase family protein [bacterium]MDY6100619.1 histidine phosphatase family protein [Candidatus Enteromonas sp.]